MRCSLEHPDKIRERASVVCVQDGALLVVALEDPATKLTIVCIPGGALEPGEDARRAAERETLEETGYTVCVAPDYALACNYDFFWNGAVVACRTHFFLATLTPWPQRPALVRDAPYHRGVAWVAVDELERLFSYHAVIRRAVAEVVQAASSATSARRSGS